MSVYDKIAYGPRTFGIRSKSELDGIAESSLKGAARRIDLPVMHWLLATPERGVRVKHTQPVHSFINFQLVRDIFLNCSCILPYCINVKPLAPKFAVRYAYQHVYMVRTYLSIYHFHAFPLT